MHWCRACVRVSQPIRVLFLQRPRTRKLLNSAAVIANRKAVAARALACAPTLWLGPHAHLSLASQMCRAINDGSLLVPPPGQDEDEEEEEEGEGGGERRYQARPGLLGSPQRACHICTGTGLPPPTSALGLGSPVPTSAPGLRLAPATKHGPACSAPHGAAWERID